VLLHLVRSAGHIVHSGASNFDALFFMLRWERYNMTKSVPGHTEIVFLHPMGSASHVVHAGVSGGLNIDALTFKLG
jgi:hypothetical protein